MFNKYFWSMFVCLCSIAILHIIGTQENYYWSTNWYDFPMHFLGGLWLALFFLWLGSWVSLPIAPSNVFRVFVFVLIVGIFWELYELYFHITDVSDHIYVWDTSHDLIMDITGGLIGWYLFHKKLIGQKNEQI